MGVQPSKKKWNAIMSIVERTVIQVTHQNAFIEAGLRFILASRVQFDVLPPGEAKRTSTPAPRVLILDHESGLRWASDHHRQRGATGPRVMIVSTADREPDVRGAFEAGVDGYVVAGFTEEEVVDAVHALAQGRRYLCGSATLRIADRLQQPNLTPRERDVLALISRGHNNKEVARSLGISLGTVKTHMRGLLSKLDARCRTEALWNASKRGLIARHTSLPH